MWPDGEVKLLSDQVLDSVDVAEACGGHANLEPHGTFHPSDHSDEKDCRRVGASAMEKNGLLNFEEARKSPEFEKMFRQLLQELMESMENTA